MYTKSIITPSLLLLFAIELHDCLTHSEYLFFIRCMHCNLFVQVFGAFSFHWLVLLLHRSFLVLCNPTCLFLPVLNELFWCDVQSKISLPKPMTNSFHLFYPQEFYRADYLAFLLLTMSDFIRIVQYSIYLSSYLILINTFELGTVINGTCQESVLWGDLRLWNFKHLPKVTQ